MTTDQLRQQMIDARQAVKWACFIVPQVAQTEWLEKAGLTPIDCYWLWGQ